MSIKAIKCSQCGKFFIDVGQIKCPFCDKIINKDMFSDIFGDIFGKNNPFDNFGRKQ